MGLHVGANSAGALRVPCKALDQDVQQLVAMSTAKEDHADQSVRKLITIVHTHASSFRTMHSPSLSRVESWPFRASHSAEPPSDQQGLQRRFCLDFWKMQRQRSCEARLYRPHILLRIKHVK